jgi:hypothetical protein
MDEVEPEVPQEQLAHEAGLMPLLLTGRFRDLQGFPFGCLGRGGAHFQPPLNERLFSYESSALLEFLQGRSLMADRPGPNLSFADPGRPVFFIP